MNVMSVISQLKNQDGVLKIALTLQCYKLKNKIMNYRKVKRIQKQDNIKNITREALSFIMLIAGFWLMLYLGYRFMVWSI